MKLEYRDRGTSGTQLDVMSGSIVVCRLWKAMQSNDAREESWQWTWSMDRGPPDFRTSSGAGGAPGGQGGHGGGHRHGSHGGEDEVHLGQWLKRLEPRHRGRDSLLARF
jgi:hypothetical protein